MYTPIGPLDALDPDCLHATCVVYDYNDTFIRVTWGAIACAQSYVLVISDMDPITTSETSHQASYGILRRNISGSLLVVGGSVLPFFEQCSVLFNETATIPPPATTIPPTATTIPPPEGWFSVRGSLYTCTLVHVCIIKCASFLYVQIRALLCQKMFLVLKPSLYMKEAVVAKLRLVITSQSM